VEEVLNGPILAEVRALDRRQTKVA